MNEIDRNTRTLIVSFVLAIMVLIPLRFVEVGQMSVNNDKQVLGESYVNEEVVEETTQTEAILEEPYNTIENEQECMSRSDLDLSWDSLKSEIESKQLDEVQVAETVKYLMELETKVCQ